MSLTSQYLSHHPYQPFRHPAIRIAVIITILTYLIFIAANFPPIGQFLFGTQDSSWGAVLRVILGSMGALSSVTSIYLYWTCFRHYFKGGNIRVSMSVLWFYTLVFVPVFGVVVYYFLVIERENDYRKTESTAT